MNVQYHKHYSHSLQRDMEYKIYGHKGKPVLVFPTSCGRFYQYEDNGMIDVLKPLIEQGKLQIWTADGIDEETFFSSHWNAEDRLHRHRQYDQYIAHELIPDILQQSHHNNGDPQRLWTTGCSLGAYHSANFFFRYPHHFDGLLALSGVYSTRHFFNGYTSESTYHHSPVDYLANNTHHDTLESYRNSRILICVGQGAYEELMVEDTHTLHHVLQQKNIPHELQIWGHDAIHDWDWWKKQLAHYIYQWT